MFEFLRRVAKNGHDVYMVTSLFAGASTRDRVDGMTILRVKPGIRPVRMLRNYAAYRRHFAGKVDVALEEAEGPQGPFFIKLFVREPVVLVWFQLGKKIFLGQFGPFLGRILSLLDYVYAQMYRANLIALLSNSSAREIVRVCPVAKTVVLHPGLPDPETPLSLPSMPARHAPEGRYLVTINKIRRYKAFELAVLAFGMVAAEFPDLKLVLGGVREDLKYEEELRRLGETLAPGRVAVIPDLSFGEKDELLRGAYAFVLPSPVEGFSVATLEALSRGTPAIVTGGVPEDLITEGFNGVRFRFGDVADLAEKYRYLLRNPKIREELSAGARITAGRFDWDRSADVLQRSLEAVIAYARSPSDGPPPLVPFGRDKKMGPVGTPTATHD